METTLRSLFRYFLGGLVFIVPLAVTVYFIVEFFNWLDNLLGLP